MLLRPHLRGVFDHSSGTSVCRRCLIQLLRARRQKLRSISTTTQQPEAAAARSPTLFGKKYFLANGFLDERFRGTKRGYLSATTAEKLISQDAVEDSQVSAFKAQQVDASPVSAPQGPTLEEDVVPHRRRRRPREASPIEAAEPIIPPDASSRLSDISSRLPSTSLRRAITSYLSLAKPRLSFLIVLTTTASYSLYPVPALLSPIATSSPSLSPLTLLFLTSGTALTCASANALNMLAEPVYDAKMSRTRNRPLVRKLISPRGALIFAAVTGIGGVAGLFFGVNPTVAGLSALNIILYAGVYTPLKRISVVNTWVGALVGGIPPLMGWTAAAGQSASADGGWQELLFGEGSAGGWLLAALLFCWQFPHFNALSWTIREEYKNAGHRMLAWTNPAMNGRVAFRYALLMVPVCVGLWAVGVVDQGFLVTSSIVNGWMIREAWRFWKKEGKAGSARGLFWASVWHLPIVLVLAMAHKKGLWERLWSSIVGEADDEEEEYMEDGEELGDAAGFHAGQGSSEELR